MPETADTCVSHAGELECLRSRVRQLEQALRHRPQDPQTAVKATTDYRRLVESLKHGYLIYSHDTDGDFGYISPSITNVLGYEPEEFLGHYDEYFTDNPVNIRARQLTEAAIHGEPQAPYEVELRHKDGSTRWFEVMESPIRNDHGQVMAVGGIACDITCRKRVEEEFRESNERLRLALLSARMGTWSWEIPENRVDWSEELLQITGIQPHEFGGNYEAYLSFTAPEVRDEVDCQVKLFLADRSASVMRYDHPIVRGDGQRGWVEVHGRLFRDDDGRPVRMTGICGDITERKRAEQILRQAHDNLESEVGKRTAELVRANEAFKQEIAERCRAERNLDRQRRELQQVLDSAVPQIWHLDTDGRVVRGNATALGVTGSTADQVRGRTIVDLAPNWDNPQLRHQQSLDVVRTGRPLLNSIESLSAGNETRWVSVDKVPWRDEKDNIIGVLLFIYDITDRRRAEEELRQSAETQKVLLREVNHRVKNNLSAIIGMLQMEEERADREGMLTYLPVLRDLIGRIQGLSTVHSLLSAVGWSPLGLSRLCTEVVRASLQTVPLSTRVDVSVADSSITVTSQQAHHLTLVINELATNASKHAFADRPDGRLNITFSQEGDRVTIDFRDDGPGFPDKMVAGDFTGANVGYELINGIVTESLDGNVCIRNDGGGVVTISFTIDPETQHTEEP